MIILYGAKNAFDITGGKKEVIEIEEDMNLKSVIDRICKKYHRLAKEIDDGDVLVVHNGVLRSFDSVRNVNNKDTIEFAPVILGG